MSGVTRGVVASLLLAFGLVGCSDDAPLDPVGLEGIGDGDAADDGSAVGAPDDDADDGDGEAEPDGTTGPSPARGPVDGQLAPGPFEVAGVVVVDLEVVDGALRLVAVDAADGWRERARSVDDDGIELELVRDAGGEATVEIELDADDGELTIETELEVDPAEPGTFVLGDAGQVTVAVRDGVLVVDDLRVADGWQRSEDRGERKLKLELERGDETWKAELRLRDGRLRYSAAYDSGDVTLGS